MEDYKINGKAIYTPKGAALEYGRVGCNFYTGCPHDCGYCYLKRGIIAKQLGSKEVKLKKCFKDAGDAMTIFMKEVEKNIDYLRKYGVFFSFTTDPLIIETRCLTFGALAHLVDKDVPVKLLTKNAGFVYDFRKYFANYPLGKLIDKISFGYTLTGRDDMEMGASPNDRRIESMRILHQDGFKTWASIEPVIDWDSSVEVVSASLEYCDHYKIGLRSGVGKDYYNPVVSTSVIIDLVNDINFMHRTVYLKEIVRRLLQQTMTHEAYNELMRKTVDMDGNPITSLFYDI